ncbi:MFS-type transporter clz9-like [Homalodisca vitripennis]|uniref:MFS-type transporter clz9-like n=1 Tax=Homalodisca vitripennis TaxID=197043 RepID=UPI001EEB38EA|nr:MFS-type transporter clz9-like [Homalodisca vitripennis]
MVCGNAAGVLAPPYVNYKAEKIWSTWTENGPPDTRYNRTKSGWFDSNSFEDWFVSLMLPILKKQEGPKVIIGDNLSSHINIEVIKQCEMNNIKFIALPPNATHLLQPLDVAFFRPMKVAWRKILKDWKETAAGSRCTSVPKDQFPNLLNSLWGAMIKGPDNLIAGFRKSGIYPINREPVLKRLPSGSLDASISSIVGESFLEQITMKRQEATQEYRERKS